MELDGWSLSKEKKVIKGLVLYDLSLSRKEGDKYKAEVLSILYQHGHVLVRTPGHNIICWSIPKRGRHGRKE